MSHDRKIKVGLKTYEDLEFLHLKLVKLGQDSTTIRLTMVELQQISNMEIEKFEVGSTWRISNGKRKVDVSLLSNGEFTSMQISSVKYHEEGEWKVIDSIPLSMEEYQLLMACVPEILTHLRVPPRPIFNKLYDWSKKEPITVEEPMEVDI